MSFGTYLLVTAGVTYAIRALPLALVKGRIRNRFVLSFLHYVPYAVLSVMTIPAIFTATSSVSTATAGFVAAVVLAWRGRSLVQVAAAACGAVLLAELVLRL